MAQWNYANPCCEPKVTRRRGHTRNHDERTRQDLAPSAALTIRVGGIDPFRVRGVVGDSNANKIQLFGELGHWDQLFRRQEWHDEP